MPSLDGTDSDVFLDLMVDPLRVRDLPAKLVAEVFKNKEFLDTSCDVTMYRRWLCPEPEAKVAKEEAPSAPQAPLVPPPRVVATSKYMLPLVSRAAVPHGGNQFHGAMKYTTSAVGRSYGYSMTATTRQGTSQAAYPVYRVVRFQQPAAVMLPVRPQPLLQQPPRLQYVQQLGVPPQAHVRQGCPRPPRASIATPPHYVWRYSLLSQRPM